MSENLRKLVTVRTIDGIEPIEGADAIELAVIEGWKVVIKKGEFTVGARCVYFEIDSFLPTGNPAWQFLVDKSGRDFEGVYGHRLRTIKLRGQISQGLVLPLSACPEITTEWERLCRDEPHAGGGIREVDFSDILGIKKWEAPLPAELAGQAEGLFPSWMRKTDQERCQNLISEIFQTEDTEVPFDDSALTDEARAAMVARDLLVQRDGVTLKVNKAKADANARYEISMKLDGSSCTMFHRDGEVGVCSRNLQLKVNEENASNTFVKMLIDSGLQAALPLLGNIAIQGELMGPSIQGNREQFKDFRFYIFDVQNLDTGEYFSPAARRDLLNQLAGLGVKVGTKVFHVPVFVQGAKFTTEFAAGQQIGWTLAELGLTDVKGLLAFAEGPSIVHPVREGVVFKRFDGKFSFKVISDVFLAKEKD